MKRYKNTNDIVAKPTGPLQTWTPYGQTKWVRNRDLFVIQTITKQQPIVLSVKNLPDIITESDNAVVLPDALMQNGKEEERSE